MRAAPKLVGSASRVTRACAAARSQDLEFEIPFRELAFSGVPYKTSSTVFPTVKSLVDLIETPFLVLTLKEIEVVNLERVGFALKNFDMAIVFRDFTREVHRIDAIDTKHLETIKEWLNSLGVKYYESKMNLNWKPILKTILDDPTKFVEEGGWDFLDLEKSDDEDEDEEESDGAGCAALAPCLHPRLTRSRARRLRADGWGGQRRRGGGGGECARAACCASPALTACRARRRRPRRRAWPRATRRAATLRRRSRRRRARTGMCVARALPGRML